MKKFHSFLCIRYANTEVNDIERFRNSKRDKLVPLKHFLLFFIVLISVATNFIFDGGKKWHILHMIKLFLHFVTFFFKFLR